MGFPVGYTKRTGFPVGCKVLGFIFIEVFGGYLFRFFLWGFKGVFIGICIKDGK